MLMARMRVLTCVTVMSIVVCGVVQAGMVPYTLGKTTIMVDSDILGYNSPLLSYLKQGMPLRRGDDSPLEAQTDDALQDDSLSEEVVVDEEKLTSRTPESDQPSVSNQDFHSSPEGSLAIKILPGKHDTPLSGQPTPITMNKAAGIYYEGQRVPIPDEENIPPLYYNVQTPNFAQVSEKIHNIITSLSPTKVNDRSPSPSRHPPIHNALPLQLHARPGDTPPSLANTEGFTGVSVKHMVPEESGSYEDHATNNDDLNFLLSNDPEALHPLLQSDIQAKPFGHDGISPMGHIWSPAGDIPQQTRVRDDEETNANNEHESLFSVMVTPQHHKSDPSSGTQLDGNELQVTVTDSSGDEVNTIETSTTLPASVIQVSSYDTGFANEDSSTPFPHTVNTVLIPTPEVETVIPQTEEMNTAGFTLEVDTVTPTIGKGGTVTPTADEIDTTVPPVKEMNTTIPTINEVETVTPLLEEEDTITYATEESYTTTQDSVGIDLDNFLSIKIDELQRDEVDEAVLGAEEEEDQAALDQAMADLFGNLFSSVSDSPNSESEDKMNNSLTSTNGSDSLKQDEGEHSDSSVLITDTYGNSDMDSVFKINVKDSNTGNGHFPPFPTKTFQTGEEQRTSQPHSALGDDPLTSFSDSHEETLFAGQGTKSSPSSSNYPTQDQFHYSAAANFPTSGDEPEQQSPSPQGISSLRHDLSRPTDQQGLKSWFDREPITIFDPLHSPNPGSSLSQGVHESQLAVDSLGTRLDSEETKDNSDSQRPVNHQAGIDLETSPDNDSVESEKTMNDDISNDSETPKDDDDSATQGDSNSADTGTLMHDDDSETPQGDEIFADSGTSKDDDNLDDSDTPEDTEALQGDDSSDDSDTTEDDTDLEALQGDSFSVDSGTPEDSHDSDTPKDSDNSGKPEDSNDPDKPEDSDDSGTPEESDDSDTPEDSDDSGTPEDSDDSGTPEDSADSDTPEDSDDSGTPEDSADSDTPEDSDDSGTPEDSADSDTPEDSDDSGTPEDSDDSGTAEDSDDSGTAEDSADSDTPEDSADSDTPEDSADSDTPEDSDDSGTPEDSDDSGTAEDSADSDTLEDEIDSEDSAASMNIPDTLRQAESNTSLAGDITNSSTTASSDKTPVFAFPGAVLHNAGPGIFQKSACQCGLRFATKVVGGQPTTVEQYPWIVGLYSISADLVICAGTIISDTYILTAAHCIRSKTPSDIRVRMGATNKQDANAVEVGVKTLIPHKKYSPSTAHKFDIGLIELERPVDYSEVIFPACLAPPDINLSGKQAKVSGWGKDGYSGQLQDVLQEATVTVLSTKSCRQVSDYKKGEVNNWILCASAEGKDACQGDSGGPLIYLDHHTHLLIGIVSWGNGCAEEKFPGIYTKISSYGSWIRKNMKSNRSCLPAYTLASKKKKKGTSGGEIRDTGAIDQFLSTWTQPDDAGHDNTTRRKGQGNNKRQNQGNASREEEGATGNTKKKGHGNKTKHDQDDAGTTNTASGEQSSNNRKKSDGNKGQGQLSDRPHNAQDENEPELNVGVNNKHNKRKHVKNKNTGGLTHVNSDSAEGISEEDDWSNIPLALKGIAQIILREADTNN